MSKVFYAVNRETGERWKPEPNKQQFLMMFDTGYLAVVEEDFYTYITKLDNKIWQTVVKNNIDKLKRHETKET